MLNLSIPENKGVKNVTIEKNYFLFDILVYIKYYITWIIINPSLCDIYSGIPLGLLASAALQMAEKAMKCS